LLHPATRDALIGAGKITGVVVGAAGVQSIKAFISNPKAVDWTPNITLRGASWEDYLASKPVGWAEGRSPTNGGQCGLLGFLTSAQPTHWGVLEVARVWERARGEFKKKQQAGARRSRICRKHRHQPTHSQGRPVLFG
jgi:hypothetical protein